MNQSSWMTGRPGHVVAVKATIDRPVRRALATAGVESELLALPFPVRHWRDVYVRELAATLRRWKPQRRRR
jgi:hypothetical protein